MLMDGSAGPHGCLEQLLLVMGIGNIFKIDDRYINIDR